MTILPKAFCQHAVAYVKAPLHKSSAATTSLTQAGSPVLTDLENGLLMAYVVDQDNGLHYVQHRHLQAAGLTEAELTQQSLNNLCMRVKQKDLRIMPVGDIFAVLLHGNFEASLILLDSLWDEELAHLSSNTFVAAIPSRDILAFCDGTSISGIQHLYQAIERSTGGDHPLIQTLLYRNDATRGWMPYPGQ